MPLPDANNILLYSTSAGAQVWAALLVFQVLLVRDQKATIGREIDDLWNQARHWWKGLIQALRNDGSPNLGSRLEEFGLDKTTVDRAETDRDCFKKLMRVVHAKQIILKNDIHTVTLNRTLTPDTFQSTMDPISERLLVLEMNELNPRTAFFTGMTAIIINMGILLALDPFLNLISHGALITVIAILNGILLFFFSRQIWNSLEKG